MEFFTGSQSNTTGGWKIQPEHGASRSGDWGKLKL